MKKIIAALFAVSTLIACSSTSPTEDSVEENPSVLHFKNAGRPRSTGNLIDHGGKVLNGGSNTYAIWWGDSTAFPADAQGGITALFQGLNGSSILSTHNQYMRSGSASTSFHTNWTDTSTPIKHGPAVSDIVSEACKVIGQNGESPDPNGVYFVFASNFPRINYCAWHSHGSCNGVDIQVAYMPNTTGVWGCDPGDLYGCNSYSQGTRSLANVTSHEFFEAITDANLDAWYDNSGAEGADKCAWKFSSCVTLTNGSWQLQQAWSNAVSGCVQQ